MNFSPLQYHQMAIEGRQGARKGERLPARREHTTDQDPLPGLEVELTIAKGRRLSVAQSGRGGIVHVTQIPLLPEEEMGRTALKPDRLFRAQRHQDEQAKALSLLRTQGEVPIQEQAVQMQGRCAQGRRRAPYGGVVGGLELLEQTLRFGIRRSIPLIGEIAQQALGAADAFGAPRRLKEHDARRSGTDFILGTIEGQKRKIKRHGEVDPFGNRPPRRNPLRRSRQRKAVASPSIRSFGEMDGFR
jgi:hypothetical protein